MQDTKTSTLLSGNEFYKGRKMIPTAFENRIFPLPKYYSSESS